MRKRMTRRGGNKETNEENGTRGKDKRRSGKE